MAGLVEDLAAMGFAEVPTGGGCVAMVRFDGTNSDVVTDMDGCSLPEADDWLYCRYAGRWMEGDSEELEGHDSDGTMVDLITLLRAGDA